MEANRGPTEPSAGCLSNRTSVLAAGRKSGTTVPDTFYFFYFPANRIALPTATDTGERAGIIPQISTDGFAAYPEAVDLAFGAYCRYGQLIKDYRNRDVPGRYGPPELVGTDRRAIFGYVPLDTICTSHAERVNLTTRTLLKRFTRLSLCFSKKLENLVAAVAIYVAYYNFCWQHKTLGGRTPAMAAGLTSRPWYIGELFDRVMQTEE